MSVFGNKPKMLRGLNQNGTRSRLEVTSSSNLGVAPPAKRQNLTYAGIYAERGKPVILPQGKATRKASRESCRSGITEKANAVLHRKRVRIETLSGAKAGRLRCWSFSMRKVIESVKRRKQMTAVFGLAGALLATKVVTDDFLVLLNQWL